MMMRIQYDTLFEVEIYHKYYKSGFSEDFDIEPTAICQRFLRNYGLLYKKTTKGFKVLYQFTEDVLGKPHPIKTIDENAVFSFKLTPQNPFFINYSNLPLGTNASLIYRFHNLNNNLKGEKRLLSSKTGKDIVTESDSINLRSQFFQYRLTAFTLTEDSLKRLKNEGIPADVLGKLENLKDFEFVNKEAFLNEFKTAFEDTVLDDYIDKILEHSRVFGSNVSFVEIKIDDEFGEEIYKEAAQIVEGVLNYPVNLRDCQPGKYILKIDGLEDEVFYASDELMKEDTFSVIDIYRHDDVPDSYRFTDPDAKHDVIRNPHRTYAVAIDNRKTLWRYNIFLKYQKGINSADLSIESYTREKEETFPDKTKRVTFVSNTPLDLKQEPKSGITLKKKAGNGNGGEIILVKDLPNPTDGNFKPVKPEDNVYYSEMFVYL